NSDCPLDESFGLKAETEESFGLKADQVIFMPGGVRDPGAYKTRNDEESAKDRVVFGHIAIPHNKVQENDD
ncbi:MAG: hypothetical protein PVF32_20730, partial [Desulfobacterales bacterium]